MYPGLFITFEGIEGSGKSTQIRMLAESLRGIGYEAISTREPGGTHIGDEVRDILLDPDLTEMDFKVEVLLYAASRAQLISQLVLPALKGGKIVLSDRYIDSSLAYQSFGRDLPFDTILEINKWATEGLEPDLTVLLDISAEEGLKRATKRFADRIEQEALGFHMRVEEGYRKMADMYSQRYFVVDASLSKEEIHNLIVEKVKSLLKAEG